MADEADLAALRSGEKDMVRRDFRDAKFIDEDFSNCNFSYSLLSKGEFVRIKFKDAILNHIQAQSAKFIDCDFTGAFMVGPGTMTNVDFSGSKFVASRFNNCVFYGVNFWGVDFTDADFSESHFEVGCQFEAASSGVTTKFDHVAIRRSLASADVFRYYKVENGVLIRKNEELINISQSTNKDHSLMKIIQNEVMEIKSTIDRLSKLQHKLAEYGNVGHNSMAFGIDIIDVSFDDLIKNVNIIDEESKKEGHQDGEKIKSSIDVIQNDSSKIWDWIRSKIDKFADSLFAEMGKTAADWKTYVGLWACLSGKLDSLVNVAVNFLSKVP